MKVNHMNKLEDYLRDIEELASVDLQMTKDRVLYSHSQNVTKAIKICLNSHEIKTEKKVKKEPSVLPYETLDPLLAAYDMALEQRDEMLDQANRNVDKLADLVECLVKENKSLYTEILNTKTDYKNFVIQQGKIIR